MGSVFGNKTEDFHNRKQLVGVHISKEKAHLLALYCLHQNTTRSKILAELLDSFFGDIPDVPTMIDLLSEIAKENWNALVEKNKDKPGWRTPQQIRSKWWDFRKEAKDNLKRKRIPKEIINKILEKVDSND